MIVPVDDDKKMAKAIQKLIDDESLRNKLGEKTQRK